MADYVTPFGKLLIPVKTFEEGNYGFGDVIIEHRIDPKVMKREGDRWLYDPSKDERVPKDIRDYMGKRIEAEKVSAQEKNRAFFDGQLVRVRGYRIESGDNDPDEHKRLAIQLAPTSFFLHTTTNLSLDEKVLFDDGENSVSIREKYNPNIDVMDDFLGNGTGANLVLISKPDHEMIYVKRASGIRQYPGMFGVGIAGFMNRERDLVGGVPNPFVTWQREGQEEMGVECPSDGMTLLHLARAGDDLHYEISGMAITPFTVNQVMSAPKKSKYEQLSIHHVPFEPKAVLKAVAVGRNDNKRIPFWVPAHAKATIEALYTEYSHDQIMAAMEEVEHELGL